MQKQSIIDGGSPGDVNLAVLAPSSASSSSMSMYAFSSVSGWCRVYVKLDGSGSGAEEVKLNITFVLSRQTRRHVHLINIDTADIHV